MTQKEFHYMLHKQLRGLTEAERQAIILEAEIRSIVVPTVVIEALREHIDLVWLEQKIKERKELERIMKMA